MTMLLHNHFTTSRIRASFTASTFDHFSNRPNTWGGEEGLQPSIHRSTYLSTCLSIYLSIYLEYKRSSSTCMNSRQILERNPHLITLAQSLATRCSIPSSAESAKKKALILPTTREAKTGFDCLCLWEVRRCSPCVWRCCSWSAMRLAVGRRRTPLSLPSRPFLATGITPKMSPSIRVTFIPLSPICPSART